MTVERKKDEILIRLSANLDLKKIESMVEYFNLVDILSQNKGKEEDAIQLAREVNKTWWKKNRSRFIK